MALVLFDKLWDISLGVKQKLLLNHPVEIFSGVSTQRFLLFGSFSFHLYKGTSKS